ncbi:MAG: hypothetical protein M9921_14375 [Fimbriimonadaceae bacterium]|nr:hypothetical protein [Chthonomonadaceae bacterium]MCO5298030.1 hypothetical protein [Fimbriimonadaceae bacterium]
MNIRITNVALAAGLAALVSTGALAQTKKAETGLVGIKLYDTGLRLVSIYGSPDDIQAVSFGGGAIGPGGGGGAAGRGAGPGGVPGAPGGGKNGPMGMEAFDFSFGTTLLRQGSQGSGDLMMDPNFGKPPGGGGAGPGAGPTGPGGGGAAGLGGGGAGTTQKVIFTRWVYKRAGSQYGFILDKFNRVVQIEAIGLSSSKVRTSTGLGFGSSFASIIKTYGAPDGYELMGDNLVVRYLIRNKVAFRLSRLGPDKPHVVTGVVVAGGKT